MNYFFRIKENNKNITTLKLFRFLLYLWIFVFYNTLAFKVNFFWGRESYIPTLTSNYIFGNTFLNLFNYDFLKQNPIAIIIMLNLMLFLNLKNLNNRIYPVIIYYLCLSLDARAYYILDGGNNLVSLLLIYNIFFRFKTDEENFISTIDSSLSNLFYLMAKIQICIVYFVAGHMKLTGDLWTNGTALYYTLSVGEVSLEFMRNLVKTIDPIFFILGSYFVLSFQLTFPWLIWFKKTRKWLLRIGVAIHLGISFILGLTFFGYALCVSYSLFYDQYESKKLIEKLKRIYNFFNIRLSFIL